MTGNKAMYTMSGMRMRAENVLYGILRNAFAADGAYRLARTWVFLQLVRCFGQTVP